MIVVNEALLDVFRGPGRCEWCKGACNRDPHHVWAKGMGSGSRFDVRINLIGLCRFCHGLVHSGEILRTDLMLIVAAREGVLQSAIESVMMWLKRMPKAPPQEYVENSWRKMNHANAALAKRVWGEICQPENAGSAKSPAKSCSPSGPGGEDAITF